MPLENTTLKLISAVIRKDQISYFRRNRLPKSKFIRQAIDAHIKGEWEFDDDDDGIN